MLVRMDYCGVRERNGQRKDGPHQLSGSKDAGEEFCLRILLRHSLVLWLPIRKCQVGVTLVIGIHKRRQRPVCGQGAQGRRLDTGKVKLVTH